MFFQCFEKRQYDTMHIFMAETLSKLCSLLLFFSAETKMHCCWHAFYI